MISIDTLKELVQEEALSEIELELLVLALADKTPTEIKQRLNIPTENAVQKKLSKIYAKFRIPGAGPGKLPKLRQMLEQRSRKRVLLCWSGPAGQHWAQGLKETVFQHPGVEALVSKLDMNSPSWLAETEPLLDGTIQVGVVCLDSQAASHVEVGLAVGWLLAKLPTVKRVEWSQADPLQPVFPLSIVDGTSKAALAALLNEAAAGRANEAQEWVNFKLSGSEWWNQTHGDTDESSEGRDRLSDSMSAESLVVAAGQRIVANNRSFRDNEVFQGLILTALDNISRQLESVGSDQQVYRLPLELYPRYLIYMQRQLQVRVRAVAMVDNVEHFWPHEEGYEIGRTAHADSERVFIFPNMNALQKYRKLLEEHASRYQVFVTTTDTYLPLVLRNGRCEKEYAIIQKGDSKIVVWYDEESIKNSSNKKIATFSANPKDVKAYEEFFEYTKKSQGVLLLPKRIGELQRLQDELNLNFQELQNSLSMAQDFARLSSPEQLLEDLQDIRNRLLRKTNREEAIRSALQEVQAKLNAQTVAIFLFRKDGRLHRERILGTDRHGEPIDNRWFRSESYSIEQRSFTGQAAIAQADGYGKPQWTNCLGDEDLDGRSKQEYLEKLGELDCAIAVPLNGQTRTYGVIEVINKVDPETKKKHSYGSFDKDEIAWLWAIGSAVANVLSNIRRERQGALYADLADLLVKKSFVDPQASYQAVAERLCSDFTAFEVCILRLKTEADTLNIIAKAGAPRINWQYRDDGARKIRDGLIWKAIQSGKPEIVAQIDERIDEFKNKTWIEKNQLKSFAVFPLCSDDNIVGTLSVYTGYEYDFHDSCQKFLGRVASLVAAFIQRVEDRKLREAFKQQICRSNMRDDFQEICYLLESAFDSKFERANDPEVLFLPVDR